MFQRLSEIASYAARNGFSLVRCYWERETHSALKVAPALSLLLDQRCDQAGPARLVAGAHAASVISVEILIERDVVTPVRVSLEVLHVPKDRSPPLLIACEDVYQPS